MLTPSMAAASHRSATSTRSDPRSAGMVALPETPSANGTARGYRDGWAFARNSRASGSGLHRAMVRKAASFTITAYDFEGKQRTMGGDPFMVAVRGKSMVRARVIDNTDGTYSCQYRASVSGVYTISLSLYGVPVPGSPFPLEVFSPVPDPHLCRLKGAGLMKAVAREPACFEIEFIDAFGAVTRAEELDCFVELVGEAEATTEREVEAAATAAEERQATERSRQQEERVHEVDWQQKLHEQRQQEQREREIELQQHLERRQFQKQQQQQQQQPRTKQRARFAFSSKGYGDPLHPSVQVESHSASATPSDADDHKDSKGAKAIAPTEDAPDEGMHARDPFASPPLGRHDPFGSANRLGSASRLGSAIQPHTPGDGMGSPTRLTTGRGFGGIIRYSARRRIVIPPSARERSKSPRRFRLDPTERQQHMMLWKRRLHTEGVSAAKPLSIALTQRVTRGKDGFQFSAGRKLQGVGTAGPSFAHELMADERGVAFAYGGVDPGTVHAGGKLVRVHSVHYSVGRAGRYKLHVGLRQQSSEVAGSPFELYVAPGIAHATWTHLASDDLPLHSVVGETSKGVRVISGDRMGNRCLVGGAPLQVWVAQHTEDEEIQTKCIDNGDGTYLVQWFGNVAGTYTLHVTLDGAEVGGSPVPLTMYASKASVSMFQLGSAPNTPSGLKQAIAGVEAIFRIEGKDEFGNNCEGSAMQSMKYGLALVQQGTEKSKGGDKTKGDDASSKKAAKSERGAAVPGDAATRPTREPKESMDFTGTMADGVYEIRYVAQKAGNFALHAWCIPDSGERERLPGSPFTLSVSEGAPSARNCFMRGLEAVRAEGPLPAGQEIVLHPQLRDAFGNAAASNSSLTAELEAPDGVHELTVKSRSRSQNDGHGGGSSSSGGGGGSATLLGSYEVGTTPEKQGNYTLHVKLNGEEISDSPVVFAVEAGTPTGTKSRLIPPTEPFYVGHPCTLMLEAIDKFENRLRRGGATVGARAAGNAAGTCTVDDMQDGTYVIRFTQNAAGDCKVVARVENVEVAAITVVIASKPDAVEVPKQGTRRGSSTPPFGRPSDEHAPSAAPAPAPALTHSVRPPPKTAPLREVIEGFGVSASSSQSSRHGGHSVAASQRSQAASSLGAFSVTASQRSQAASSLGAHSSQRSQAASTATDASQRTVRVMREVIEGAASSPEKRSGKAGGGKRSPMKSAMAGKGALPTAAVLPGPVRKLSKEGSKEVRI